ncbi:hypothetical protein GGI07_005545, partial [Coemansia sp. Benny D115]
MKSVATKPTKPTKPTTVKSGFVKKATTAKKTRTSRSKAGGASKKLSSYNKFMKDNLAKYKAEHEGVDHKEAFKAVAHLWANSPENKKNNVA